MKRAWNIMKSWIWLRFLLHGVPPATLAKIVRCSCQIAKKSLDPTSIIILSPESESGLHIWSSVVSSRAPTTGSWTQESVNTQDAGLFRLLQPHPQTSDGTIKSDLPPSLLLTSNLRRRSSISSTRYTMPWRKGQQRIFSNRKFALSFQRQKAAWWGWWRWWWWRYEYRYHVLLVLWWVLLFLF